MTEEQMTPLMRDLDEKVSAGYSGIYLQSAEHEDAIEETRKLCVHNQWMLAVWDQDQGLVIYDLGSGEWSTAREQFRDPNSNDGFTACTAQQAVREFTKMNRNVTDADGNTPFALLMLKNGHRFLEAQLFQQLLNQISAGRTVHQTVVILSPLLKMPAEYEAIKALHLIEHALPERKQLHEIAEAIAVGEEEMPTGDDLEKLLDAGAGLPRLEFENACALSIIRHNKLMASEVLAVKQQSLKTAQGLTLHGGKETFADIGGLDFMKRYCLQTLRRREPNPKFRCRGIMIMEVSGGGKCLGRGTPVIRFDGSVCPVEDIKVGDLLMGPDSKPRRVLGTTRGHGPLYRVTPVKGDSYVVNEHHVLSLKRTGRKRGTVENVSVSEYLAKTKCGRSQLKGWRTGVEWPARAVPVPAYILGTWLGDGHSDSTSVTTPDQAVVDAWRTYADELGLQFVFAADRGEAKTYRIAKPRGGGDYTGNTFREKLRTLGVFKNKHIPQTYLANSREIRLELLAGILDTDGYMHHVGYDIVQKRKVFAEHIVFLARSLGFAAYMKPCMKYDSRTKGGGRYYRVSISGHVKEIPVRIPRRKAPHRKQVKSVLSTGISVRRIDDGEYFGFSLSGDHLFLLGDFTVTHNSLFAKALGNEVERPTLHFDIGSTMGSLLGQSQQQFRKALATADAMSPCILFIDECEKALSGVQGSARTDGGVKAEIFGCFLSYLQDHTSDVFVIATANDVRKLSDDNPELIRRFDNLFFVDFPGTAAKEQIWKIHLAGYELWDPTTPFDTVVLPNDAEWTGAEIEVCCRQARLRGLTVAEIGKSMPRIADQAKETIDAARSWASGRCYAAEYEGLYQPEEHANRIGGAPANGSVRRRIGRAVKASVN